MSEAKRDDYDDTCSATASVASSDENKSPQPVHARYIRYADGTLEEFDEEEIWGQPEFESESGPPSDTDYDRILDGIEESWPL